MVNESKMKSPGGVAASSGGGTSPGIKPMFSWQGGAHPVSVIALQKLSSLLLPHATLKSSCPLLRGVTQPIMPVNDIMQEEARVKYARGERFNRCSDEFLVTPYGMLYNEVSASNLIKVDSAGNVLDQGKTHLSVKPLAWSLHSALYRQRPDARCVLHLRTPQVIAVSVFKNGLLPASNDAVLCIHGAGVAVYLLDELLEPRAPATATTEQVETAARTESESGATGAAADAGAVAAGASAGAGEQQAEGEAAAHVEQSECESGIEKGESNVQVERSSIDSTGSLSPVRQEPPQEPPTPLPESDEQRARRVYEEKLERVKQVANELGSGSAKIVLVRGHGALVMGETLEEAVYYARKLQEACVAQLGLGRAAAACAMEEEAARAIFEHEMALSRDVIRGLTQSDAPEHWRLGEFEFENYMRYLDEAGYRTGHVFRLPVSRLEQPRERRFDEGIEIPPTTSTLTYYSEPGEEDKRPKEMPTGAEWVITPSQYEREVLEEGGIKFPQKYTKWNLQKEDGPGTVAARMEDPHSFVEVKPAAEQQQPKPAVAPRNQVKVHQQEVKQMYYRDIKTAGPLSRILDDRVIEHAVKVKDDVLAGKGERTIIIGHASNGIIQKEFQHTGETYQTFYGPNPFHGETEDDLRDYMRGMKVQLPSDINFLKPSILEQKPEPPPVAPKPASVPATPSHVASAASVPQPAATSTPTAAQKQPQQPQPQPPAPAGHTATVEGQTLPTAQKASVGVVLSETTLSTESSGSATTPKASATLSASTLPPGTQAPSFASVPSGEVSKTGTLDAKALKKAQKEKEKAEKAEKERKKKEEKERAKREKAAAKAAK